MSSEPVEFWYHATAQGHKQTENEIRRRTNSSRFILTTRDEICLIQRQLEVRHLVTVRTLIVQNFRASNDVEHGDFSRFVPSDDEIGFISESAHRGLRSDRVEHVLWFARLCTRAMRFR